MKDHTEKEVLRLALRRIATLDCGEPRAIEVASNYLRDHPHDTEATLALGRALRTCGRCREARELLEPLYASTKAVNAEWDIAVQIAMATEPTEPRAASRWFEIATQYPGIPGWVWIFRGANLATLERFEEAIDCYRHSMEVGDVDRDEALMNIGLAYRAQGMYREARVYFQRSLMVTPDDQHVISLLAGLPDPDLDDAASLGA